MTSLLPDLSRASLNDIIFEGRNKAYGAYDLRIVYPQHLKRAMIAILFMSAALGVAPYVVRRLAPAELVAVLKPVLPAEDFIKLTEPPVLEKLPVAVPVAPPQSYAAEEFSTRKIVADKTPVTEAPVIRMDDANRADNLAAVQTEGLAGAAPVAVAPVVETGGGAENDEPMVYTEVMPEFPGGLAALQKYIADHTKYPALALRNGVEGKVYIKFVVDATGHVVNPVVLKGIGGGCDEEALRVVRSLPAFKPGEQNGRAVKVYYNLPISFRTL